MNSLIALGDPEVIMRSIAVRMAAAFLVLAGAVALKAQTVVNAGQVGGAPELTVASASISPRVIPVAPYSRAAIASVSDEKHDRVVNRIWIGSIAALIGSTSMDAATSWGKNEGNALLASSDGKFGAKGLSIKVGTAGLVLLPQIMLRKHKQLISKLAVGNFAEAGIFTAVSVHNLTIAAPKN